jgi:hypothetical protein
MKIQGGLVPSYANAQVFIDWVHFAEQSEEMIQVYKLGLLGSNDSGRTTQGDGSYASFHWKRIGRTVPLFQKRNEVKVITVYRFLWYDSLDVTIS